MKRLSLEVFKSKKLNKSTKQATDKLLAQVLGDCHDHPIADPKPRKESEGDGQ